MVYLPVLPWVAVLKVSTKAMTTPSRTGEDEVSPERGRTCYLSIGGASHWSYRNLQRAHAMTAH